MEDSQCSRWIRGLISKILQKLTYFDNSSWRRTRRDAQFTSVRSQPLMVVPFTCITFTTQRSGESVQTTKEKRPSTAGYTSLQRVSSRILLCQEMWVLLNLTLRIQTVLILRWECSSKKICSEITVNVIGFPGLHRKPYLFFNSISKQTLNFHLVDQPLSIAKDQERTKRSWKEFDTSTGKWLEVKNMKITQLWIGM